MPGISDAYSHASMLLKKYSEKFDLSDNKLPDLNKEFVKDNIALGIGMGEASGWISNRKTEEIYLATDFLQNCVGLCLIAKNQKTYNDDAVPDKHKQDNL